MRQVAQRLPYALLAQAFGPTRTAGAPFWPWAVFLPEESVARLRARSRASWLRNLWEIVVENARTRSITRCLAAGTGSWPDFDRLTGRSGGWPRWPKSWPILPKAERRPWPESADKRFAELLLSVRDEFWEKQATLTGSGTRPHPCRLLGEERVHDILINVFLAACLRSMIRARAERGLIEMTSQRRTTPCALRPSGCCWRRLTTPPNSNARLSIQQGLLQIYRDYCLTDCSQCQAPAPFPSWSVRGIRRLDRIGDGQLAVVDGFFRRWYRRGGPHKSRRAP